MTTTWEDVALKYVPKAAYRVVARYAGYTEVDDITQEMLLWLYGDGRKQVEKWLANEPQQLIRTYRRLEEQGVRYAERQKAISVGYHVDDVAYYTPKLIEGLMPLVLDAEYTRPNGKVDDVLAMVLDIRRVLSDAQRLFFLQFESSHVDWADTVQDVVNKLGGRSPYRRRAMSNAAAQALTKQQETD